MGGPFRLFIKEVKHILVWLRIINSSVVPKLPRKQNVHYKAEWSKRYKYLGNATIKIFLYWELWNAHVCLNPDTGFHAGICLNQGQYFLNIFHERRLKRVPLLSLCSSKTCRSASNIVLHRLSWLTCTQNGGCRIFKISAKKKKNLQRGHQKFSSA